MLEKNLVLKLQPMRDIDAEQIMQNKSMDWFLYDNGLHLERVNSHYFSNRVICDFNFWDADRHE